MEKVWRLEAGEEIASVGVEHSSPTSRQTLAIDIEDEVIGLPTFGEVFLSIVVDLIRARRLDHFDSRRAANARHFCAKVFRKLKCIGTIATRWVDDPYLLAGRHIHFSLLAKRGHSAAGAGSHFFLCHAGTF